MYLDVQVAVLCLRLFDSRSFVVLHLAISWMETLNFPVCVVSMQPQTWTLMSNAHGLRTSELWPRKDLVRTDLMHFAVDSATSFFFRSEQIMAETPRGYNQADTKVVLEPVRGERS